MIRALKSKHKSDEEGYELVDLLRQSEGEGRFSPITHPENHVDSIRHPLPGREPLLPDEVTCKALDYIFYFKPLDRKIDEEAGEKILQVSVQKTKVEKMMIEGADEPCRLCSDHYAVSAVIE